MKRLRTFLKNDELDPNTIIWREELAIGTACSIAVDYSRIKRLFLGDESSVAMSDGTFSWDDESSNATLSG